MMCEHPFNLPNGMTSVLENLETKKSGIKIKWVKTGREQIFLNAEKI